MSWIKIALYYVAAPAVFLCAALGLLATRMSSQARERDEQMARDEENGEE